MTFVSYAQNFEDVILWRALKGVDKGFYIDVGAQDPDIHSVTKAFYERGWRGINIEPVETFFNRLLEARSEDRNLRLAAAEASGVTTFYEVVGTGLSTTERQIACRHRNAGHNVIETQVETDTLGHICQEYVIGEVHFLKIDVEGGAYGVIKGWDFDLVRPWIIVVEATEPMSQAAAFDDWEPLITGNGYRHVYFDGLNRFYVAEEHDALIPNFHSPPNVFDDFVLASSQDAVLRAQQSEERATAAETEAASVSLALAEQRDRFEELSNAFTDQAARTRAAEERAHKFWSGWEEFRHAFTLQVARTRAAEERAHHEASRAKDAETERVRESKLNATLWARLREREELLLEVFQSRSWRLTAVLRILWAAALGRRAAIPQFAMGFRRPRPTIFVECTHTYHSDLNTGIQRVVRNILRNAPEAARHYGYDVVPVIVEGDRFRFAQAERVLSDKQNALGRGTATGPSRSPASRVRRRFADSWVLATRPLRALFPAEPLRELVMATRHRPGLPRWLTALLKPFRRVKRQQRLPPSIGALGLDDFDRLDGSILLLLDSSWTIPIWAGVRHFKEHGGMVVGVVYDLIPITHRHTSVPELTAAFEAWLTEHLRLTDGFVCISRSIAEMLKEYVRTRSGGPSPITPVHIDYFYLGSELDFAAADNPTRPSIKDIFAAARDVFLMVGSIEPRKMHTYVLDAFDGFWATGRSAALLVVGRQSWKMEEFLARVAAHPQLNRQLFLVRDATDGDLDYCYHNASALIIASEIEGFGLPIVEAFQCGLPVICSDIPVFREIADGKATYFSLCAPTNLQHALQEFCDRANLNPGQRVKHNWITWRESSELLVAAAMRVCRDASARPP